MSEITQGMETADCHAWMRILAEEAMADPDFVATLQDTMQAFQHVDKENWPLYDEQARHAGISMTFV